MAIYSCPARDRSAAAAPAAAADGGEHGLPLSSSAAIVALACVTVYLGLFPQILFDWIRQASQTLTAFWGVH